MINYESKDRDLNLRSKPDMGSPINTGNLADDERITLTKRELVEIIQSTVTNILKRYNK